ncbi:hypothetical protein LOZ12_006205 [Ophidiomyces ophidiicola]|uniref:Uncharacterized protein n=1 Tax=Ophidiomyces ophidiicola TaxID=1387563 RepID=A0ACB8V2V0_9EURO|nr:uncharacterized protein LOZ57_003474 [Ophidiomyces ophidiicola]KAI1917350.1 hypothetical protein LOZ61_000413 [Ophidiomyces ophidiicola]KAI1925994.1 hypothetical protein LOZ60_003806 [Ophidiomyces ophidiicola]KAI1946704.1 hypothetical protein LOZ57_003474 [Ophidiomyces ophidiicola]KAI1953338.1 hypothetical protein LOZ59_005179 [Ophidiomyces ophidiicola]KAI1967674.1 hypothetical protein LOZ56_005422 [Ophidiomyces ophidiicola]
MDGRSDHSRQSSTSSSNTEGAALPWILEHLLAYPGSYEIPLRTMYSLNSTSIAQPPTLSAPLLPPTSAFAREAPGNAFPGNKSPVLGSDKHSMSDTAALFKAQLMSQIAQLPSQPCSLPPSFITSFVRRCFPPIVEEVDFPQSLTALDYLRDLENRRRKGVMEALSRLGISGAEGEKEELSRRYPGVLAWVDSVEAKERVAVALYTQVYLRLRHWTLINEMLLEPFNKANCIAMLNTLFPPVVATPPTAHLNSKILQEQRMHFYNLILDIGKRGKQVLEPIIQKDMRPGDTTGWPVTQDYIEKYLRAANAIIDECSEVTSRQNFEQPPQETKHKNRKVDSGISFMSIDRPSTSSSVASHHTKHLNKPLPQSPTNPRPKGGTTLERIAKEIRKMKSRSDLGDSAKEEKKAVRGLKRMKSGLLKEKDKRNSGSSDSDPAFDPEEFKQRRKEWEAKNAAKLEHARRISG